MAPTARDLQANAAARATWLSQGLRGMRALAPLTTTLGGTVRQKLDPIGLLTGLIIRATCRIDITAAAAIPSVLAPYNLLTKIRLTDDQATDRIVIRGEHAYALQAISERGAAMRQSGLIYSYPLVPTSIGANQLLDVSYYIPICGDQWRDLRGALYMPKQSQTYVYCDFNASLLLANNAQAVYVGDTTTGIALNTSTQQPTVEIWQCFLEGSFPLPQIDLTTVHYLDGAGAITSGLAAGIEQMIDYPTSRYVRRLIMSQLVDGAQAIGNAQTLRSVVRSNYDVIRQSAAEYFVQQRRALQGSDLPPGFWWLEHSPELASAFSREYQAGFTPAVTGATSQSLNLTFESFGA